MKTKMSLILGAIAFASACACGYSYQKPEAVADKVCWTYLRPPACEESPEGVHTCCDHLSCHTWVGEAPTCWQQAENVWICCGLGA